MSPKDRILELPTKSSIVPLFILVVRWLMLLGVILRFVINLDKYTDRNRLELAIVILIAMLAIYTFSVSFLFFRKPNWYDPQKFVRYQIVFEVLLYSLLYIVTLNPQSDFYLFYFLPMLLASQYLDTKATINVFLGVSVAFVFCVLLLGWLTSSTVQDFVVMVVRVVFVRWVFFLLVTFFIIYRMMILNKQSAELAANNEIAQRLLRGESLGKLLNTILRTSIDLLQADGGTIYLRVPGERKILLAAMDGFNPEQELKLRSELGFGQDVPGYIMKNRKRFHTEVDYSLSNQRIEEHSSLFGAYLGVALSVPAKQHSQEQEDVVGVLSVFDHHRPTGFDIHADVETLLSLSRQAALAIRWFDLYEREKTMRNTLSTISSTLEFDTVIKQILEEMKKVVPYHSGSLQLIENETLKIVSCIGFPQPELVNGLEFQLSGKYPNAQVISTMEPCSVADVRNKYPVFQKEASTFQSEHIRSWLGVPLILGERVQGMFALDRHQVVPFTNEEIKLAQLFANHAAKIVENARLFKTSTEQEKALNLLHRTADMILQPSKSSEVLDAIVQAAADVSEMHASAIYMLEDDGGRQSVTSHYYPDEFRLPEPNLDDQSSVLLRLVQSKKPVLVAEVDQNTDPILYAQGIRSLIALPILLEDVVTGAVVVFDDLHAEKSRLETKVPYLSILAGQATIAVRNARLLEREQRRVEELIRTKDYLDSVLEFMEGQRKHTMFGIVYGESVHFTANKLGMAKKKLRDISGGTYDSDIAQIKRFAAIAEKSISEYEEVLKKSQRDYFELPVMSQLDIHAIIRDVIGSKRISGKIERVYEFDQDIPSIFGPEKQLSQIFFVLIDNAVKSMGAGVGKLTIRTKSIEDGYIRVSISDTGKGIPESVERSLFEMRARNDSKSAGRGLGLAWARATLRQFDGDISYERQIDVGTTMHVTIPEHFELITLADL